MIGWKTRGADIWGSLGVRNNQINITMQLTDNIIK